MDISSVLNFIVKANKIDINSYKYYEDFPMSECCSFKTGGNASLAIFPLNSNSFENLLVYLDAEKFSYKVIGNGTNIIPSDEGFDGVLVITTKISSYSFDGTFLTADCGVNLTKLAKKASLLSLCGMENFFGIPATVGGAVYMNAGAYNSQVSDIFVSAKCYNHKKHKIETYNNEEMRFSYRFSRCHDEPITVICASFRLGEGNIEAINARMNEVICKRKNSQPLEFPNAGSIFKRPLNNFAGKLIEEAGLKGYSIGGAEVSAKHAGFFINRGNATSNDIIKLIQVVREKVLENSGIMLECEVEFI